MSIDIHISNYEEFLYSYVDGELGEAAVAALEAFMDAHPHVRQELDLLLATRLTPEPVVFDLKASLYRGSEIDLHNYEPFLLNYVDGELTASEAAGVEQFAAAHPAVQKELDLFRATRLQPDTNISFGDKAALYRRSTPVRRIQPAYWWGAAAAVVAGALFFLLPAEQPAAPPAVAVITKPAANQPAGVPEQVTPGDEQAPAKTIAKADEPSAPAAPANPVNTQPATAVQQPRAQNRQLAAVTPVAPVRQPVARQPKAEPVTAQPAPQPKPVLDLASVATEAAEPKETVIAADLKKKPAAETVESPKRPVSVAEQPEATLATAAPATPPGELIMSVTGNGIESKVLDKVTNVARLFARKRNK